MNVFVFVLLLISVILGFVYLMSRLRQEKEQGGLQESEAAILQEMYRGLAKMEQRIETLETLLLDRERADAHDRAMRE